MTLCDDCGIDRPFTLITGEGGHICARCLKDAMNEQTKKSWVKKLWDGPLG